MGTKVRRVRGCGSKDLKRYRSERGSLTMRSSLAVLLTLPAASSAFVARIGGTGAGAGVAVRRAISSSTTSLANARVDTADAVAAALEASKKYGATSKEARVAWDVVEEMDASDNSAAYATEAVVADEKADYYNQIRSLSVLMSETKTKLDQMRQLADSLKNLELTDPSLTKLGDGPEAEAVRKALAEAKAAQEVHGPHSAEADAAWESLEKCANDEECEVESSYRYSAAALRAHHTYDAVVDSKLLEEAVDAFDSIDNLGKFVNVEKNRLDKAK